MILTRPTPPFVELGFYFADQQDHDALRTVTRSLLKVGGRLTGNVYVHTYPDAYEPFGGPTDFEQELRTIGDLADLDLLRFENCRPVTVQVGGITPGDKFSFAEVTFGRVMTPNRNTHHPIQVWLSGDLIDTYAREPTFEPGQKAGAAVGGLFREAVAHADPSYAALTIERTLATPEEFTKDPLTEHDFSDFYLAKSLSGPDELERVHRVFEKHARMLHGGLLVITSRLFGASEDSDRTKAAAEFAKSIRLATRTLGG